jgi:hypothetical protein
MKTMVASEEHFRRIKVREFERDDLGDNFSSEQIEYYLSSEFKIALLEGDEVVIIMGGKLDGVLCHTWLITSELMYRFRIEVMKSIVLAHLAFKEAFNVERFFTFNPPHHLAEMKFLERLGYVATGVTRDFDDNKERILFVMEAA